MTLRLRNAILRTVKPTSPNHEALARIIEPPEHLTFSEVAKLVGSSAQAVRLWLREQKVPNDDFKAEFEAKLGLPRDQWVPAQTERKRSRRKAA